jgi:hypothetical protein
MTQVGPFRKVPVADMITPTTGTYTVLVDYWWMVTDDDCLLLYRPDNRRRNSAPQCNANRQIAEKVARSVGYPEPTEVRQLPVVFVPLDIADY